jgi:hypothetical protein
VITVALVFIAAFFNAVMDAVENENYFESIFKKLPQQFWYKRESWKYAAKVFGYKVDAWHLAKSCMLICFAGAVISFNLPVKKWQDVAFYTAGFGIIWNVTFWLFYHVIFKVK